MGAFRAPLNYSYFEKFSILLKKPLTNRETNPLFDEIKSNFDYLHKMHICHLQKPYMHNELVSNKGGDKLIRNYLSKVLVKM